MILSIFSMFYFDFVMFLTLNFSFLFQGHNHSGHGHSHGSKSPEKKPKGEKDKEEKEKKKEEEEEDDGPVVSPVAAYLNLVADFTHNVTDGLAIGASFKASHNLGVITTIAVLLHEVKCPFSFVMKGLYSFFFI